MTLSDRDLREHLYSGHIGVEPLAPGAIQPASIDVHLDAGIRPDLRAITAGGVWPYFGTSVSDPYMLAPGEFALASTIEYVRIPDDVLCLVHGRSSVARGGLIVHGAGQVGQLEGTITHELANLGSVPYLLTPGMGIAQLTFELLSSPAQRPYGSAGVGRYQWQQGATVARPQTQP